MRSYIKKYMFVLVHTTDAIQQRIHWEINDDKVTLITSTDAARR